MEQKVTVNLILYSRHVSAIHGHHQVSVAMLNCCTVLHVNEFLILILFVILLLIKEYQ
jgi:hypothetical protein